MKYKVLDVKLRNPIARCFSIEKFRVTVQLEDGRIMKFNAWAGSEYNVDWLIWDIRRKIRKILEPPKRSKLQEIIREVKSYEEEV